MKKKILKIYIKKKNDQIENNKYVEITVDSDYDIEQINTVTNNENYMDTNLKNKNIWIGNLKHKKIMINKNISNSTNSDNSINSNVSVSDILFNYN